MVVNPFKLKMNEEKSNKDKNDKEDERYQNIDRSNGLKGNINGFSLDERNIGNSYNYEESNIKKEKLKNDKGITSINIENGENEKSEKKDSNIISFLHEYAVKNYIEYLKDDLEDVIKEKLYKDIIRLFDIKDEKRINEIIDKLIDRMFGYGILQKYIEDENVSDIRVIRYDSVYIKKHGKWLKTKDSFESEKEFYEYIRYCSLKNNSNINYDTPVITVSDKKYNLRIEMGIEPVNVFSPNIVIRIHRANEKISLETLFIVYEMLDADSYSIIYDLIRSNKNIVLAGKGGSGKTTLLREIINKLPDTVSISINEETAELNIKNKNVIQREVVENRENLKKITLEKLMKQSLVMSNDVIVVGEMKGAETSVFIDAISTGHVGYATVHSDSAENTINRLVTLFKRDTRAQEYKEEFVKNVLISSIDVIIYLKDYKVIEIKEKEKILSEEKDSDTLGYRYKTVYSIV